MLSLTWLRETGVKLLPLSSKFNPLSSAESLIAVLWPCRLGQTLPKEQKAASLFWVHTCQVSFPDLICSSPFTRPLNSHAERWPWELKDLVVVSLALGCHVPARLHLLFLCTQLRAQGKVVGELHHFQNHWFETTFQHLWTNSLFLVVWPGLNDKVYLLIFSHKSTRACMIFSLNFHLKLLYFPPKHLILSLIMLIS